MSEPVSSGAAGEPRGASRSRRSGATAIVVLALLGTACAVAQPPGGQLNASNTQATATGDQTLGTDVGTETAAETGAVQDAVGGTATPTPRATASPAPAAPSGSKAAAGGATGPDNSDTGITGDTIKIGAIIVLSGPIGVYGKPWMESLQTPLREANDAGGINGRKVQFIVCDDGFEGARGLACAKKLLDEDKVFILMSPGSAGGSPAALPYIEEKKVPVGSQISPNLAEYKSPYVFPMTTSAPTQAHIGAQFAKSLGVKKAGTIVLSDVETGPVYADEFSKAAKALGIEMAARAEMRFGDADCTSQMLTMQRAAVDTVWFASDSSTAIKCFASANNLGYKPPKSFISPVPQYIDLTHAYGGEAAQGSYVQTGNHTPDTEDSDFVREYLARVKRYYPQHRWWAQTPATYAGSKLTVEVLRSLGRNVTRQRYLDTMNTVRNAAPGLGVEITYTPTNHDSNKQGLILQIQGQKFVPVTGFLTDEYKG